MNNYGYIILGLYGIFSLVLSLVANVKTLRSFMIFKIIPFLGGMFCTRTAANFF